MWLLLIGLAPLTLGQNIDDMPSSKRPLVNDEVYQRGHTTEFRFPVLTNSPTPLPTPFRAGEEHYSGEDTMRMTHEDAEEFRQLDMENKLCPCGFRHFSWQEHVAGCCKGACPRGREMGDYSEICMMDVGCPKRVGAAGCKMAKEKNIVPCHQLSYDCAGKQLTAAEQAKLSPAARNSVVGRFTNPSIQGKALLFRHNRRRFQAGFSRGARCQKYLTRGCMAETTMQMCRIKCTPDVWGLLKPRYDKAGCSSIDAKKFCSAQMFSTALAPATSRRVDTGACARFLDENCRVVPGLHRHLSCNGQNWPKFKQVGCGKDAVSTWASSKAYRDTSTAAKQAQQLVQQRSCDGLLARFCGKGHHDLFVQDGKVRGFSAAYTKCGTCAGRFWHQIQAWHCDMATVDTFCKKQF